MLVSVVGGYSLAYYLVFGRSRLRGCCFMLVVAAMIASYLVRIYAWRTLMGETGVVNSALIVDRGDRQARWAGCSSPACLSWPPR